MNLRVAAGDTLEIVLTLRALEPSVFDDSVHVNLRGAKPLLLPFTAEVVLPDVKIVEERCVPMCCTTSRVC